MSHKSSRRPIPDSYIAMQRRCRLWSTGNTMAAFMALMAVQGLGVAAADDADAEIAALRARVARLEQRLNQPLTVRAPFVVVGKDNKQIARIAAGAGGGGNFLVYDSSSSEAISLLTLESGNVVSVDHKEDAVLLLGSDSGTGVRVTKGTKEAAFFGRDDGGSTTVTLNNSKGEAVAGLGGSNEGGVLEILRADAKTRAVTLTTDAEGGKVSVFGPKGSKAAAALQGEDSSGALVLFTSGGETAATLYSTPSGAAVLEMSNAAGEIVVQAGADRASGVGIVKAGPAGGLGGVGIPASMIRGQKSGKK